ncbi:MAG TPA: NAD(P)-dependent oxidoreductase [Gammaproteobacteria bacterium]|nr:NAD(P)-dependent oxidoreductase [Gammaproteobacteria bacterium]
MKAKTIALFGTGLMGAPLAGRLLDAGYKVVVWNRSPEKLEPLLAKGALVAEAPAQAVRSAEILITWLADQRAIQDVLFPAERASLLEGKTILQMATIGPSHSRGLEDAAIAHGAEYLEAPVLGSIPEAKKGGLLLMVGATRAQFERFQPLLSVFGENPLHVGPVGQAAAMKLAFNQLIAGLTASFSLSLGLIQKEGVRVELFMDMLRDSALYAPTFDKKLLRMLERDYANPNFPTRHLLKDTDLFLDAADEHGLTAACLQGVRDTVAIALAKGLADMDYSAINDVIHPPKASDDSE